MTQDTASASDDADESGDDDNISDVERIAREREVLARYLPVRKSGGGVRPRGRASGTNKGIKLMDGAKLAAMIVVPVERIEDEKLNSSSLPKAVLVSVAVSSHSLARYAVVVWVTGYALLQLALSALWV